MSHGIRSLQLPASTEEHTVLPFPADYNPWSPTSSRHFYRLRIRRNSLSAALLFTFSVVLGVTENEHFYTRGYTYSLQSDVLRLILVVIALLQIAVTLQIHRDLLALQVRAGVVHSASKLYIASIFSAHSYRNMLWVELGIHCLVVPPRLQGDLSFLGLSDVRVCDVLFLLSLLRGYQLLRLLYWMRPSEDHRVKFYSELQGGLGQVKFFLRRAVVERWWSWGLGWVCVLLYGAVCLYVFEREQKDTPIDGYWDSIWTIVQTEELIGSRDVVPMSSLGRWVLFTSVPIGIITLSLLLRVIGTHLRNSTSEDRFISEFLFQQLKTQKLKPAAALLIQRIWRVKKGNKGFRALMHAFRLFVFWKQWVESRKQSGWDLERRGASLQFTFALTKSHFALLPAIRLNVLPTQAYTLCTHSYTHSTQCVSLYQSSKSFHLTFSDIMYPGSREKRVSLQSHGSSSSINFKRLRTLMARDRYIRSVTNRESSGDSPRVSLEDLRSGVEAPSPRHFL